MDLGSAAIQGAKAVRRAGYKYADELEDLNPAALFKKHVLLVDHNILGELTDRLIGINRQTKEAFGRKDVESFGDDYVCGYVNGLELHRAQSLKDLSGTAIPSGWL